MGKTNKGVDHHGLLVLLTWLMFWLILLAAFGIGLFGWLSYPTPEPFGNLDGKALELYLEAREEWSQRMEDLIQTLTGAALVSLFAPFISQVMRRAHDGGSSSDDVAPGTG